MLLAYDMDGRMRVSDANLSKARVDPYRGSEIPRWRELGLDPSRTYRLLRDGDELRKAATTFNGVPVLRSHQRLFSQEYIPRPVDIVGTTGTNAVFVAPYIRNSLHVWTKAAIAGGESGDKREVSAAYEYRPDMTPGTYRGAAYDGRMTDIRAINVALVPRARAGRDMAIIGDARPHSFVSKLRPLTRTSPSEARAY